MLCEFDEERWKGMRRSEVLLVHTAAVCEFDQKLVDSVIFQTGEQCK